MEPIRWAIVGTGSMAKTMASDMSATANAVVVAVSSRSAEAARGFADEVGAPAAYDDYQDLLADPDVEAVYIATPQSTHHRLAKLALLAGKHVLCEKPLANDADEVADLVATARSSGRFFMEAMWMKFNPLFVGLGERLRGGAIGEVRSVRASFGLPVQHDGGALFDQGIYTVTLAEWALGSPDRISATGVVTPEGDDLTETVQFEYTDGRFAQLSSSKVEFIDPSASVNGTKGWITIPWPFWATSSFTLHVPSQSSFMASEDVVFEREGAGYVPMIRAAGEAIRAGLSEHPAHTWDDTQRLFVLLDTIGRQLRA